MMEIKVTDTGLGMSDEQREKLFTKFYRVRTDDTRDIPGNGLGLWITKKIVTAMKGRIYVNSIEKVGTQMSVLLPITDNGNNTDESSTKSINHAKKETSTPHDQEAVKTPLNDVGQLS